MSDQGEKADKASATKSSAESASKAASAEASKEGGGSKASASKSKDAGGSSSKSKDSSSAAPASKEGAASASADGSKAASKSQIKDSSSSKSKEGGASKSKASASKSGDGSKASKSDGGESKASKSSSPAAASKSKSEQKAKPSKSKEKPKSKSKSKDSKESKESKESKSKSKESSSDNAVAADKSKLKEKSKSKEKSKEKPKSKEKSKSKEKPKSKEAKAKSVTSTAGSKVTSTVISGSKEGGKGAKVNLAGAKIGFVGAGKMTEAIVRGLITSAKIDPSKIFVAGKSGKTLDQFKSRGITVTKRSYDIFGQYDCDIVFLAVHGFVIRSCFKGGGSRAFAFTINYIPNQKHPLYVLSLIGGVSLSDVRQTLLDPENPDKYMLFMHRIMLNIGVGYGLGMGALDVEPDSKQCSPIVRDLLSSIAKLDYFPEQSMDAVCTMGGNGLAICYYFIANLADGGFKMGLNKVMAIKLAAKAAQSAAQCLLESSKHASELQDSVTSPSGSAIYGIHVMDKADCSSGFQAAIEGSYRRLKELVDIEPVAEVEAKPFKL